MSQIILKCTDCNYNIGTVEEPVCDHPRGPRISGTNCLHYQPTTKKRELPRNEVEKGSGSEGVNSDSD